MQIPFIDLSAQKSRLRPAIDAAIAQVVDEGRFIMGPQVSIFEERLAKFCGAKHCISCANGTDALQLALMALGVKDGDAVFVPSFTFAATAEVVPQVNATPVFVDCRPDTFNMDPDSLRRAIEHARSEGLNPSLVIPVDLFGLPADYDVLLPIAREHGMKVIGDSAQGIAGTYHGRKTGSICDITTTSFFPAKPLGCYGDGGAVLTESDEMAALLDSLRVHGKGTHKYDNDRIGVNSRLDTLQAAILIEKLGIYADELQQRQRVAARYSEALSDRYETPHVPAGLESTWAQYTIKTASQGEREELQARAKEAGIPTVVYYPLPLHQQNAYKHFPKDPQGLPVSEELAQRVLSLPIHPYLPADVQDRIIEAIRGRST